MSIVRQKRGLMANRADIVDCSSNLFAGYNSIPTYSFTTFVLFDSCVILRILSRVRHL